MTITVYELIRRLEELDGDAEVRVAHQPGYPLQHMLTGAVSSAELNDVAETDMPDADTFAAPDEEATPIVWLVASDTHPDDSPYAPRALWDLATV